jgi:cytochrome c-type biogenesis protein CcmH
MRKIMMALVLGLLSLQHVYAGEAKPLAEDPAVEKRLVHLARNLRCLVCQNESLAASQADLARDLRREVRGMIKKGMTDKQITDYLVARYGDFVLYDPPVKKTTLVLWYGPFALLLIGLGVLFFQVRKRRRAVRDTQLTPEAQQRAAALLNDEEDNQA